MHGFRMIIKSHDKGPHKILAERKKLFPDSVAGRMAFVGTNEHWHKRYR